MKQEILTPIWQMRNAYKDFHLPNAVVTREADILKRIISDLEKILKKNNFIEAAPEKES